MNYLLDTCVLAEFTKPPPEQRVLRWIDGQIEQTLFLSMITIGDIQKGIAGLRGDSRKKRDLAAWMQSLVLRYDRRIIPLGLDEWTVWGNLCGTIAKKGVMFPFMDSLPAATALAHKMTVVTNNESDFKRTGATVLNVWK